jgi:hypothetical protein
VGVGPGKADRSTEGRSGVVKRLSLQGCISSLGEKQGSVRSEDSVWSGMRNGVCQLWSVELWLR